jgi:hypothetical protein
MDTKYLNIFHNKDFENVTILGFYQIYHAKYHVAKLVRKVNLNDCVAVISVHIPFSKVEGELKLLKESKRKAFKLSSC